MSIIDTIYELGSGSFCSWENIMQALSYQGKRLYCRGNLIRLKLHCVLRFVSDAGVVNVLIGVWNVYYRVHLKQ